MEGEISYKDYAKLIIRYFDGSNCGHFNDDLKRKLSKVNMSLFDGFGSIYAQAWVIKVNIYFLLNSMPKEEEIKFAAILLGVAHKWW